MDSDLVRKYKRLKKTIIQTNYDKNFIKLKSMSLISNNIEKMYLILSKQLELIGKKLKKTKRPIIYVVNNIEGNNNEIISKINNKNFIISNIFNTENVSLNKIDKNIYYDLYDKKDRIKTKKIATHLLENDTNITWVLDDISDYYFEDTLLGYTKDIIEVINDTASLIVPIAIIKNNGKTIVNIGNYADMTSYDLDEQPYLLRDLLATQRWEVLEKYCSEITINEEENVYLVNYSIDNSIKTKQLKATI